MSQKKPQTVITKKRALADLRRARDEKGADWIDPQWHRDYLKIQYATSRGAPLCIVGHVLAYEGVKLRSIYNAGSITELFPDPDPIGEHKSTDLLLYTKNPKVAVTRAALKVLRVAQKMQDSGETWGSAVAAAEKTRWEVVLGGCN